MNLPKLLETDLNKAFEIFPKLKPFWSAEVGIWFLKGELDICDNAGDYWGTYAITILIPKNYPFCVPLVQEDSKKIPREDYRHIAKNGYCCLDIAHRLLYISRNGISIVDFIRQKVYPYFANQLYYDKHGCYAGDEYAHDFAGVKQFYRESLGLLDNNSAIAILKSILSKKTPGRNEPCPCKSEKKFKRCHLESVEFLLALGRERLLKDWEEFTHDNSMPI
jgi:hypothetical protein